MLGLQLDGTGGVAVELGDHELIGLVRTRDETEMLLHVAVGAELAFFFAGPETHANGAAGLHLQRVQNAHDFHGDDACRRRCRLRRWRRPRNRDGRRP